MKKLLLFAVLLFVSQHVFALGQVGHKLVCQMAYDMLPKENKIKIDQLINGVPTAHKEKINKYLSQDTSSKITFAKSCIWADAIKKDEHFKQFRNWHFINVARNDIDVTDSDCKKDCVTQAVKIHSAQLKQSQSPWQKAQALMFLGHWVGDIHQPMHVSFKSDWGGNKTKITSPTDKCTNLHWLWDSCLIQKTGKKEQTLLRQISNELSPAFVTKWQHSTVYGWATESLTTVRLPSVNYCVIKKNNYCHSLAEQAPIMLASNYQHVHWPILKTRIQQAAVRLAYQLNTLL